MERQVDTLSSVNQQLEDILELRQVRSGANVYSNIPGKERGVNFLEGMVFEISGNSANFSFYGKFDYPAWQTDFDDSFSGKSNPIELAKNDAEGIFFHKNYSAISCRMSSLFNYEGYMNFSFSKEGPYKIGDSVEVVMTSSWSQTNSSYPIFYMVSKSGFKVLIR